MDATLQKEMEKLFEEDLSNNQNSIIQDGKEIHSLTLW